MGQKGFLPLLSEARGKNTPSETSYLLGSPLGEEAKQTDEAAGQDEADHCAHEVALGGVEQVQEERTAERCMTESGDAEDADDRVDDECEHDETLTVGGCGENFYPFKAKRGVKI